MMQFACTLRLWHSASDKCIRTYALVTRKQDFEIATEASIGTEIRSSCVSPVSISLVGFNRLALLDSDFNRCRVRLKFDGIIKTQLTLLADTTSVWDRTKRLEEFSFFKNAAKDNASILTLGLSPHNRIFTKIITWKNFA